MSTLKKPLIILELANNHMGDLKHALTIFNEYDKLLAKYKKDINFAFKLQYRHLKSFINKEYQNSNHKGVKRFESTTLEEKEWLKLRNKIKKKYKLVCTPFDELSVDKVLEQKFDYLKIASCSNNDWPLLEYIAKRAKKNQKIICSLGGAERDEISSVFSFLNNKFDNVSYLYCVALYPTEPSKLNLSYFRYLRKIYGEKICGFSTHEHPSEYLSGALAYAMGSRIFEKHINVKNRKYSINDYSVDPDQLKRWLDFLCDSIIKVGSIEQRNQNVYNEKKKLRDFKRGVYFSNLSKLKKNKNIFNNNFLLQYPAQSNQLLANDLSKHTTVELKKEPINNKPVLYRNVKLINLSKKILTIRNKIRFMIAESKVIVPSNCKIEISHHYGLEKFYTYGLCMITVYNKKYCKKLLFLFKNQKHPEQFHKKKEETFFILFGQVILKLKSKSKNITIKLKEGDVYTIKPREIHFFECVSKKGAVIEELSSESLKNDSFYLDNNINKNVNRKSSINLN